MRVLQIRRKDNKLVNVTLKELDNSYIDAIVELQQDIISGLDNKELYADSGRESFLECIKEKGKVIGCVTEDNYLIALGVYASYGYDEENYGYDFGFKEEELLFVGQIESTVVRSEYRGNKLQKIICEVLEEFAVNDKKKYIGATVSPKNKYSLDTFISRGYEIVDEKIKYGEFNRYILRKEIKNE